MLVLSVIGVIAALTIPGIIQNTQNKQTVTQLKKVYSELSQATTLLIADNDGGLAGLFADNNGFKNLYKSKLNAIKDCNDGQSQGNCWVKINDWYYLNNTPISSWDNASLILNDGTFLFFGGISTTCASDNGGRLTGITQCGWVFVDLNGFKSPNKIGRDIFIFHILNNGVIPFGSSDTWSCGTEGYGCTAKILQENAVNY